MNRSILDYSDIVAQKNINNDQKLDALRRMRDLQTDQQAKMEIQVFIDKRICELLDEDVEDFT